jgi:hypothetical protein
VTTTRILVVVMAAKVNLRHTRLVDVT